MSAIWRYITKPITPRNAEDECPSILQRSAEMVLIWGLADGISQLMEKYVCAFELKVSTKSFELHARGDDDSSSQQV